MAHESTTPSAIIFTDYEIHIHRVQYRIYMLFICCLKSNVVCLQRGPEEGTDKVKKGGSYMCNKVGIVASDHSVQVYAYAENNTLYHQSKSALFLRPMPYLFSWRETQI